MTLSPHRARQGAVPRSIEDISPLFAAHFVGLADGEGHLAIRRHQRNERTIGGTYYSCYFHMKLRRDDEQMLVRIQKHFNLGRIYHGAARPTEGRNNRAWSMWSVGSKVGCLFLCDLFERYPLWTRKSEEFEVWRLAVRYWAQPDRIEPPADWGGRFYPTDWAPLERFAGQLLDVREASRSLAA